MRRDRRIMPFAYRDDVQSVFGFGALGRQVGAYFGNAHQETMPIPSCAVLSKHDATLSDVRMVGALAAARAGDQAAYRDFLADCIPLIRQIARAQGHRGICFDELLQDVCMSLHRNRWSYDPAKPFRPWLATIVRRRAVDLFRRQQRQRAQVDADVDVGDLAETLSAPSSEVCPIDPARRASILHDAIAALPLRQREAVIHLGLSQMSISEAAQYIGVQRTALRVSYHRALKSLRAKLAPLREQSCL